MTLGRLIAPSQVKLGDRYLLNNEFDLAASYYEAAMDHDPGLMPLLEDRWVRSRLVPR